MGLFRSSLYSLNMFKMKKNGFIERKNKSFQEMTTTLLNDFNSPKYFWVEVVNTNCYLQNIIYIRPILKKTPYELWKDNLRKFDPKSDKGTFLGYSTSSKAYRVYNFRTLKVEGYIYQMKSYHPKNQIIGNIEDWVRTRLTFKDEAQVALPSKIKPKNREEALLDD
ncbi:hypothetical protein CR513_07491, partial [Mucuna pruriens]